MIRRHSVHGRTALGKLAAIVIVALVTTSCGLRSTSHDSTSAATRATVDKGSIATVVPTTHAPTTTAPAVVVTTTNPVTTIDLATTKATIIANWEQFFLPTTSIADRVALLENGASFQQALEIRSKDPLQQQASSTVKSIELTAPDRASVTYDVLLNGTIALAGAQGFAVLQSGIWKVGAESFCALVGLGARDPIPGCS